MIDAALIARARDASVATTVERLGIRVRRVSSVEMAGACPRCGGHDRFSINCRKQVWHCRGCAKGGNVVGLIEHVRGCSFREAVEYLADEPAKKAPAPTRVTAATPATDNSDNREKAVAIWREAVDPRGTVVERYLASRKLNLGDDLAGKVLRWHPCIGAMVAVFRNFQTGEPQAVCRTFLDAQARKIGRKFLGPVAGAAIMLDAFDTVLEGLHIGEGAETGLAARQLGLRPVWALGSAGAVTAFPVLGGIECLTLLRENDDASERACEACAARWHAAGREVFINEPIAGKDLNDAIRRSA